MTEKKQQPKTKSTYRNRIVGTADVDPTTLKAHPQNWRQHPSSQGAALDEILSTVGWVTDVIVNKTTGNLIDGHLRVETAIKNHEKSIPVKYVELTEDEEKMVLATFDPISAMAEADEKMLQELVNSIPQDEIDMSKFDLGIDLAPKHTEEELEEVPPVPRVAKTQRGDMFKLGKHILMCGDSTSADDVTKLMKGGENVTERANMVFTDPPYGVAIGDKNLLLNSVQKAGRCCENIQNDTLDEAALYNLLKNAFTNTREACSDDAAYYVTSPQGGSLGLMMMMMMRDAGLSVRHVLMWRKNSPTFSLGRLDYDYQHEPIFYTWTKSHHNYHGGKYRTTVWDFDKPRHCDLHPTMKPVELIENAVLDASQENDIVLDPFGGSGSTLIACENLNRRCRMLEIDPIYCDVIIERWEKLTGQHAEKITE